jgi:hypothetical protein
MKTNNFFEIIKKKLIKNLILDVLFIVVFFLIIFLISLDSNNYIIFIVQVLIFNIISITSNSNKYLIKLSVEDDYYEISYIVNVFDKERSINYKNIEEIKIENCNFSTNIILKEKILDVDYTCYMNREFKIFDKHLLNEISNILTFGNTKIPVLYIDKTNFLVRIFKKGVFKL